MSMAGETPRFVRPSVLDSQGRRPTLRLFISRYATLSCVTAPADSVSPSGANATPSLRPLLARVTAQVTLSGDPGFVPDERNVYPRRWIKCSFDFIV